MTELFSPKCLERFQAVTSVEINSTMKNIHMQAKEGKVVDLRSHIMSMTSNIYSFFSVCSTLQ
jgi:hypothetical protein